MSEENVCVWKGWRVELLIERFKNHNGQQLALVKARSSIVLDNGIRRKVPVGQFLLVPLNELEPIKNEKEGGM